MKPANDEKHMRPLSGRKVPSYCRIPLVSLFFGLALAALFCSPAFQFSLFAPQKVFADMNPNYTGVQVDGTTTSKNWLTVCTPQVNPVGVANVGSVDDYQQLEGTVGIHNRCEGQAFYYILTTAGRATFTATWTFQLNQGLENPVCDVAVFMPSHHAGAPHAKYLLSGSGVSQSPVNVSNSSVLVGGYDQQTVDSTDGSWLQFATAIDMQGNHTLMVMMNNEDDTIPGWEIAASPMVASCR